MVASLFVFFICYRTSFRFYLFFFLPVVVIFFLVFLLLPLPHLSTILDYYYYYFFYYFVILFIHLFIYCAAVRPSEFPSHCTACLFFLLVPPRVSLHSCFASLFFHRYLISSRGCFVYFLLFGYWLTGTALTLLFYILLIVSFICFAINSFSVSILRYLLRLNPYF